MLMDSANNLLVRLPRAGTAGTRPVARWWRCAVDDVAPPEAAMKYFVL